MSNNALGADDLNKQERQSDVLISTIEKREKLKKQLKIAVEGLMTVLNDGDDYWDKCQAQYYLTQIKEFEN